MGTSSDRLLINLDSHPDRTLGARALDTPVIVQRETHDILNKRSAVFKAPNIESGGEWELYGGFSGIRWTLASLLFGQHAVLHWGDHDIILEHHPGPEPGASWVLIPDLKIVFIGDAVVVNQPPFLSNADLNAWQDTLDLLLSKQYTNYTIISSRNGPVAHDNIQEHQHFLKDIQKRVGRIAKRKPPPDATEKLVPKILSNLKFPTKYKPLYTNRLRYGLRNYYTNHYIVN
jgi:glyoxylase-like metal-dependent hydrolase (beta-lactamase superfamily II)